MLSFFSFVRLPHQRRSPSYPEHSGTSPPESSFPRRDPSPPTLHSESKPLALSLLFFLSIPSRSLKKSLPPPNLVFVFVDFPPFSFLFFRNIQMSSPRPEISLSNRLIPFGPVPFLLTDIGHLRADPLRQNSFFAGSFSQSRKFPFVFRFQPSSTPLMVRSSQGPFSYFSFYDLPIPRVRCSSTSLFLMYFPPFFFRTLLQFLPPPLFDVPSFFFLAKYELRSSLTTFHHLGPCLSIGTSPWHPPLTTTAFLRPLSKFVLHSMRLKEFWVFFPHGSLFPTL